MSAESEFKDAVWRLCLHESGHAIFAVRERGAERVELALSDTGGRAYVESGDCDTDTKQAIGAACGRAAECIADTVAAPHRRERKAVTAATSGPTPDAESERRETLNKTSPPSDSERIARWACASPFWFEYPRTWARRARFARASAKLFCRKHKDEILTIARELFAVGYVKKIQTKQEETP
jgi:hypothetical protein